MESQEDIEMQIWAYLDGAVIDKNERQRIASLIEYDNTWKQAYKELSAFHTSLFMHVGNDMPSMSFNRNIMEAVAHEGISKPALQYINPAIIKSIAAIFILALSACFIYACTKVNWVLSDKSSMDVISNSLKKLSIKPYSGALINMFIGINIMLALLLGDKLLHKKRLT